MCILLRPTPKRRSTCKCCTTAKSRCLSRLNVSVPPRYYKQRRSDAEMIISPHEGRVLRLIRENKTSPEEIAIVNMELGENSADAVIQFAKEEGFSLEKDVDLIAGQGERGVLQSQASDIWQMD